MFNSLRSVLSRTRFASKLVKRNLTQAVGSLSHHFEHVELTAATHEQGEREKEARVHRLYEIDEERRPERDREHHRVSTRRRGAT